MMTFHTDPEKDRDAPFMVGPSTPHGDGLRIYRMLIDGKWVDASDGAVFESVNPTNGQVWSQVQEATADDVDKAVRAADAALYHGPWGRMSATERGHCLRRLGDLLAANCETLGAVETIDTGKMFKETRWQAKYIAEYLHFYAGAADKVSGETLPIDKPDMFVFTEREPLGVIAAIVPWNSQLFLSAVKIGPALAAGNTIVLKASEHASAPLLEFGALIAEAGIPDGVVNIITGHGEPCGKILTSHPLVARISFTGGPASAQHVIRNSAENFAELSLELGGKSPFIVFDDADIDSAVNGSVGGIFAATGQSCVAGSRVYLHENIADEFLAKMTAVAKGITIGDPHAEETEMGPLCTTDQRDHIEREIAYAIEQGGRVLHGGKRPADMDGYYFEPTIIECPRQDMRIVDTELFGPVLSVVRFRDEDEVIAMANDTKHGLAAGIFTRDGARSMRVAKAVRAGIVWVNTYRVISPIAEFGGAKNSGYGRESGFQALYDYTRPKTVWVNTSSEPLASQFVAR
jgi:acyl-CoA reductase-like NAD-dependent aldehyde dehydrogenase